MQQNCVQKVCMIKFEVILKQIPQRILCTKLKNAETPYVFDELSLSLSLPSHALHHITQQLVKSFKDFDRDVLRNTLDSMSNRDCSGTTANVAYILPHHIVVANAGDSRAVLGQITKTSNGKVEAIPMSFDHKPKNEKERERIIAAGGHVSMGRVDGDLAVSRALGDFIYKNPRRTCEKQKVSPVPDIKIHRRSEDDRFLILACDGIWDVMSNEDAVRFVSSHVAKGWMDMERIASELLDTCLRRGSRDNMSVILIVFKDGDKKIGVTTKSNNKKSDGGNTGNVSPPVPPV